MEQGLICFAQIADYSHKTLVLAKQSIYLKKTVPWKKLVCLLYTSHQHRQNKNTYLKDKKYYFLLKILFLKTSIKYKCLTDTCEQAISYFALIFSN